MADEGADQVSPGSPFWRFSVAFYRRAGVAEACLALQDGCGVDVNLLMFLLWLATACRRLPVDEVRALDARLDGWRSEVVRPLRAMRRRLKTDPPLVASAPAQAFRARVKALELEAERLQQESMEALSGGLSAEPAASPGEAACANVGAYEVVRECTFPREPVACLLAQLPRS